MPNRIIGSSHCTIRFVLIFFALAFGSAAVAVAQSPAPAEAPAIPSGNSWQSAQSIGSSKRRLLIVTVDEPYRRQSCRVKLFNQEKLVCSRAIGGPRTYLPGQLIAVILPGDAGSKLGWVLGLNGGLAAAIWATVVLAAPCPACAVATGIVAFYLFVGAGAVLIGDDQPDRLLYLAPGQQLPGKLGFVQP